MAEDCTPKCGDLSSPISSSSIIYKGELLRCIGADIPDTLEAIVKKLDSAICQKLTDINALNRFINTGAGIELYTGQTVFGQNQIATLSSPDGSITITYNETTEEVNLVANIPEFQQEFLTLQAGTGITIVDGTVPNSKLISADTVASYLGLTSQDNSVIITPNADGSVADLSVDVTFPAASFVTLTSPDSSVNITQSADKSTAEITVTHPTPPDQIQSDVTIIDPTSKAFIKNQNPTKSISTNYTLTSADNNYVIVANSTNSSITITVPATGFPTNNYFVGIIQKGGNNVTISGADIIPTGYQNVIEGQGHNAAIDVIEGDVFLLGSLKEIV